MNEYLRDRILRKLDTLSDERGYQLLDYVEFLESKYAEKAGAPPPTIFQRFSEAVEDGMRAGRVSASTISEAMGLMNRALGVLNGVAAAGKSVATDIVSAAKRPPGRAGSGPSPATPPADASAPPAPSPEPASAPTPTPEPSASTMTQPPGGQTT
jgi:hypothetical protein